MWPCVFRLHLLPSRGETHRRKPRHRPPVPLPGATRAEGPRVPASDPEDVFHVPRLDLA